MGILEADLSLAAGEESFFKADGRFQGQEALVPEQVAQYAGRSGHFRLGLAVRSGGAKPRLRIDPLFVQTEKIVFGLNCTMDMKEGGLDGAYELTARDLSPLARTAGLVLEKERKIQGRISGNLLQPVIQATTDLGTVVHAKASVQKARLDLELAPPEMVALGNIDWRAKGALLLSGPQFPGPGKWPDTIRIGFETRTRDFKTLNVGQLEVNGGPVRLSADGSLRFEDLMTELRARLEIGDLGELSVPGLEGLAGRGGLDLHLTGSPRETGLKTEIQGKWLDLQGLPAEAIHWLGNEPTMSLTGVLLENVFDIHRFVLQGRNRLEAGGRVHLDDQELSLDFSVLSDHFSQMMKRYGLPAGRTAELTGNLAGPFHQLSLKCQARAEGITPAKGLDLTGLTARIEVRGIGGDMDGRFDLNANQGGGPVKAGADFRFDAGWLSFSDLRLSLTGSEMKGGLKLDTATGRLEGRTTLTVTDFSPLGRMLDQKLAGRGEIEARFSAPRGRQSVHLKGALNQMAYTGLSAGLVTVQAEIPDLKKPLNINGKLKIQEFSTSGVQVKTAEASLAAESGGLRVRADLDGKSRHPFHLKIDGVWSETEKAHRLVLNRFSGQYQDQPIQLARPVSITLGAGLIQLDNLDLNVAAGSLKGKVLLANQKVQAGIDVQRVPLTVVNMFSPQGLAGRLNGRLDISGNPKSPRVNSSWNISGLKSRLGDQGTIQPADVDLGVDMVEGRLSATARIKGWGPEPGQVRISLPAILSLQPFKFQTSAEGRLDGRLSARIDLGMLPHILALDDQVINGLIGLDFSLSGTLDRPQITGDARITEGRYENVRIGAILKDIQAHLTAEGPTVKLVELTATDGASGRLEASGGIVLEGKKKSPYQVRFELKEMNLIRQDLIDAGFSGWLAVEGDTEKAGLSGEIRIDRAEVNVPGNLSPGFVDVDMVEVNTTEKTPPKPKKSGPKFNMALNLKVISPGRFFVRGQGADSEWKGTLAIGGSTAQPRINGDFNVIRGRYVFLDRRFTLSEGTLLFDGSYPPAPVLNVLAETTIKSVVIQVRITGSARSPKIALESDPTLPQDEILAYILFGRALDKMTPMQALSLANATRKLALGGGGSGNGIMDQTRELLHLDELEIKKSDSGGTSVGAGKYLNEKVYVEAEKGLDAGSGKLSLEIEITPNISLETEVGDDSQSGVGLNWKKDY